MDELVSTVAEVAGKEIHKNYIEGPVGVQARNFDKARIKSLGWGATTSLKEGITRTYEWIDEQVRQAKDERR